MSMNPQHSASGAVADAEQLWFGHPRGLATLFFTEMWERFSYYGMRGLLVLFMTTPVAVGNAGLGLDTKDATAIYGLYTAMVYLVSLPGGWVADKVLGLRASVFWGGVVIASGHFTMASPLLGVPDMVGFVMGLGLIVIGTGLLKPSISSIVGELYKSIDDKRDAGFSIYYMGINLGALMGPLLCGYFGEGFNWHLGFSLAGFGMVAGLIQYRLGQAYLGDAGLLHADIDGASVARNGTIALSGFALTLFILLSFGFAAWSGLIVVDLQLIAAIMGAVIILMAVVFFGYVIGFGGHSREEKRRVWVIIWLFILSALFWSGFEQAGSSMNLFARELTDLQFGDFTAPASWLQSVNPLFIILLAPLFAAAWTWLGARNANPSLPLKFGFGFIGLALGFFVLAWGAANATPDNPVSPVWLIVTYFLHSCGELFLSPLGLSAVTKLSPQGRIGQMMGVWFIGAALGNLIGGLLAGFFGQMAPSMLFGNVAIVAALTGFVAMAASPFVRRMMGGVR